MANLWIRNQNKRALSKIERIYYESEGDFWAIYERDRGVLGNEYLGLYPTEKRCIEIIDEIQKLLLSANPKNAFVLWKNFEMDYEETKFCIERARKDNFFACFGSENDNVEFLQPNVLVYEMPEE